MSTPEHTDVILYFDISKKILIFILENFIFILFFQFFTAEERSFEFKNR